MITPEDFENNRVIWREVYDLKPFKIPDDSIKCPNCQGFGKVIKIYKDPGPNEYMTCSKCDGEGFIKATNANQRTEGEKNKNEMSRM